MNMSPAPVFAKLFGAAGGVVPLGVVPEVAVEVVELDPVFVLDVELLFEGLVLEFCGFGLLGCFLLEPPVDCDCWLSDLPVGVFELFCLKKISHTIAHKTVTTIINHKTISRIRRRTGSS